MHRYGKHGDEQTLGEAKVCPGGLLIVVHSLQGGMINSDIRRYKSVGFFNSAIRIFYICATAGNDLISPLFSFRTKANVHTVTHLSLHKPPLCVAQMHIHKGWEARVQERQEERKEQH